MDIAYQWAPFDALSGRDVHDVLALRSEIFVVEQTCIYQDVDGNDPLGRHLLARRGDRLVAYLRVLPAGTRFARASIGRVVVHRSERGTGLGRALMREALLRIEAEGPVPLKLSAQAHLQAFYESVGFTATDERYDEDGIPHVAMIRG